MLAIHDEQLAEHGGGLPGIRDEGVLEFGLDRPRNILLYSKPDIFDLAADYACDVGDKASRSSMATSAFSAVLTELFLDLNGYSLDVDDTELVSVWRLLADNKLTQEDMAEWLRKNASPR